MKALALLIAAALLTGCAVVTPPKLPEAIPLPLAVQSNPLPAKPRGGGVWAPDRASALVSDTRQFRAGDVLTVMLQEVTQASKRADTQLGKQSGAGLQASTGSKKTDLSLGAQREFSGGASSSQQNQLQGAITVVVHEVMGNGLLRVQGEKSLTLNQGEELIRLGGYVRATDVDADNRVSSQRIANARIVYSGQGHLADTNTPGWLTRLFNSPLAPF
ncbi:MAG TPA: flagellar basal body L-ring protein FlgH [Roseateles sp.]